MNKELQFFLIREGEFEQVFELTDTPALKPPTVRITEYDKISFVLRSAAEVNPFLYIQDYEMEQPFKRQIQNYIEYRWRSNDWFLNHFGYSSLTLDTNNEQSISRHHASIEVFATKLNEERADKILSYLEDKMEDITRTCFNATHKRADTLDEGDTSASIMLQTVEEHLDLVANFLPHFRYRKRKRVVPTPTLVKASATTYPSEHSIGWVMSHLDTLLPAIHTSPSSVTIGGKFYELDQIETNVLVEDTNVYENQIIAGYLESIAARLSEIETFYSTQLALVESEGFVTDVPDKFVSIFEIKRKFGRKHYGKLLVKCQTLQTICSGQSVFFQQYIPVRSTIKAMPKLTSGFLASPHYYQSFRLIVKWYRTGRLNFFGERFFYGLRALNKLYEFFCLFRLIETIRELGWNIVSQEPEEQLPQANVNAERSIKPYGIYVFRNRNHDEMTLFYEPRISKSSSFRHELIRVSEGGSYFLPDFVIHIQPSGYSSSMYILLDSKYVKPLDVYNLQQEKRYADKLTEITMKYVHGIGSRRGGISPVNAVFAIHPKDFYNTNQAPRYRSYHSSSYSLFSKSPTMPILGAIEVSPDALDIESGEDKLTEVLRRTIEAVQLQN